MLLELYDFWCIITILVCVLFTIAVITLIIDAVLNIIYYKWDKEEREQLKLEWQVGDIIEANTNPDGVISEVEN